MNKNIKITIKELAELLITVVLQDKLNYTYNSLLGQPIAIIIIPPTPP